MRDCCSLWYKAVCVHFCCCSKSSSLLRSISASHEPVLCVCLASSLNLLGQRDLISRTGYSISKLDWLLRPQTSAKFDEIHRNRKFLFTSSAFNSIFVWNLKGIQKQFCKLIIIVVLRLYKCKLAPIVSPTFSRFSRLTKTNWNQPPWMQIGFDSARQPFQRRQQENRSGRRTSLHRWSEARLRRQIKSKVLI